MTCNHCTARVETALRSLPGVFGVYVDLGEGAAEVDFDDQKVDVEALVEGVKTAGYEARATA